MGQSSLYLCLRSLITNHPSPYWHLGRNNGEGESWGCVLAEDQQSPQLGALGHIPASSPQFFPVKNEKLGFHVVYKATPCSDERLHNTGGESEL